MLAGLALVAGIGCASQPREIPMDTLVHIYLKIAEAKALDAPAQELDVYTKPFGFSGEDFRHTMKLINSNDEKKNRFNDAHTQAIMDEAMKTLQEAPDTVSRDTTTKP